MLLDGKVAIVSGVGGGLGREIALAFAAEGADVVLGARSDDLLKSVTTEVEALGRRAAWLPTDITDAAACERLATTAVDEFGGIDILVNNAFKDGDFKTFERADLDDWRRTFDVNLWGTLVMTKAVVPHLKARGDGRIVMVNTMSAVRTRPSFGAYSASKAALANVTRTLALELGRYGIRVNGIHPGYIWVDSVEQYFHYLADKKGITFEEQYQEVAAETALGYLPSAREVAGSAVFFGSDLSRPVTGQALGVNAGHWFQG